MNYLKVNKNRIIVLLHQLEKNKVITLFYKGRKRYFTFIIKEDDQPVIMEDEDDDYNWLEDEE